MNPDDPQFTAHALGEYDDLTAAERAEIEALLASDPAARSEAHETQALAAQLRAELRAENAAPLHSAQRAAVLSAAAGAGAGTKIMRFPRRSVVLAALAACVVVGLSVALLFPAMQAEKAAAQKSLASGGPRTESEVLGRISPVEMTPPADALSPVAPLPPLPSIAARTTANTVSAPFQFAQLNAPISAPNPLERGGALPRQVPNEGSTLALAETPALSGAPSGQPVFAGGLTTTADALSPDLKPSEVSLQQNRILENATSLGLSVLPVTRSKMLGAAKSASAGQGRNAGLTAASERLAELTVERARDQLALSVRAEAKEEELSRNPVSRLLQPDAHLQITGAADFETGANAFDTIADNAFLPAREHPLSTFSIDVDTASYAIVRRYLNEQRLPPPGAVRIEELLNYFHYDYPQPAGDAPFSATMEVAACPWTPAHRLVRIGLKGREIARNQRAASNLVFLIDVSGSMQPQNRLPLLKQGLALLIDQLGSEDQVAIVVYAGSSGTVLEPTRDKQKMHAALRQLEAGGSTNGASGLQLAYQLAEKGFIKGGTNRVILATDGDWNVGVTNQNALLELIAEKAKSHVFLTVLGVGMGNLKDAMMVKLADRGNGNYAYLDTLLEAKKVLVDQLSGTLVTIAKDVKIQVEFNPVQVAAYRLIGYEKRLLAKEDFNNDKKDAGEIGAGHTVTALYEIVPAGQQPPAAVVPVDPLKYQPAPGISAAPAKGEPGDRFVDAYMKVQRAEKAEQSGKLSEALTLYRSAAAIFEQTATAWPTWQPQILIYRRSRTATAIAALEARLADGGEPAVALATVDPARASEPANPAGLKQETQQTVVAENAVVESHLEAAPQPSNTAVRPILDAKPNAEASELLTVKLRYKEPEGDASKLLEFPLTDSGGTWEKSSPDLKFAAAVASFGMLLRDSPHKGTATWEATVQMAMEGKGADLAGYRAEFVNLAMKAWALTR